MTCPGSPGWLMMCQNSSPCLAGGSRLPPTPRCLLNMERVRTPHPPAQEAALLKSTARASKDELLHPSTVDLWVGSPFATWDCPLHWGTLSTRCQQPPYDDPGLRTFTRRRSGSSI